MMIKLFLLTLSASFLFGCASHNGVISEYRASQVPVDCLNQTNITDWLGRMVRTAEENGVNPDAIKYKLWQVRSSCQSF